MLIGRTRWWSVAGALARFPRSRPQADGRRAQPRWPALSQRHREARRVHWHVNEPRERSVVASAASGDRTSVPPLAPRQASRAVDLPLDAFHLVGMHRTFPSRSLYHPRALGTHRAPPVARTLDLDAPPPLSIPPACRPCMPVSECTCTGSCTTIRVPTIAGWRAPNDLRDTKDALRAHARPLSRKPHSFTRAYVFTTMYAYTGTANRLKQYSLD